MGKDLVSSTGRRRILVDGATLPSCDWPRLFSFPPTGGALVGSWAWILSLKGATELWGAFTPSRGARETPTGGAVDHNGADLHFSCPA